MRKGWMAFAAVGLVGLGFTAGQVMSQDMGGGEKKPEGGGEHQPSPEEMEAWMKYMTPGPEHEKMASMTGEWNAAVKMWMDAKAPPTESTGSAKFRMILGGRFQVQEYTGSMMGMPFEGMSMGGYDNTLKEHFSTWTDTMGTGIIYARGKADEKGVVTCTGKTTDHAGTPYDMREVFTHKDKDTMVFELYMKGGEYKEEMRLMEITYTRKK